MSLKQLDKGRSGTVYKIKKGSKIYAMKRRKILDSEAVILIEKFKNSSLNIEDTNIKNIRDIYFNKFINKKNKIHFAILYKYKIEECDFKHELSEYFKNIPTFFIKNEELNKSKYCLSLYYDLKDGDINEIYSKLNKNQYISLIIQIIYALYIMHQNNFYHHDIAKKNICFVKTKQEYIKILKYNIPTFGYIYSLIDYDCVQSTKYNNDFNKKIELFIRNPSFEDNFRFLSFIILNNNSYEDFFTTTLEVFKDLELLNKIVLRKKLSDNELTFFNDKILNYEETKYYINNINNEKKIIKYFYNKLKKI